MDHYLKRIDQLEKEVIAKDKEVAVYQLQEACLLAQLKKKDEELQALYGCRFAR